MLHAGRSLMYRESTWLVPEGCPMLAQGPDGEWAYACGQGWGHLGYHTWWTPGSYLAPRLITPLDWLAVGWPAWGPMWQVRSCPICGAGVREIDAEFPHMIYCDADNAERDEVRWRFEPCGCEGREFAEREVTPEP